MKKTRVALKCCIIKDSKVLVLKKTPQEGADDYQENLFDLPGGRLEFGEDLIKELKREIFEETRINVSNIKIIDATSIINKKEINLIVLQYVADFDSGKVQLSFEHDDFEWVESKNKKLPLWINKYVKMALK